VVAHAAGGPCSSGVRRRAIIVMGKNQNAMGRAAGMAIRADGVTESRQKGWRD
jgi:hypothetical protein